MARCSAVTEQEMSFLNRGFSRRSFHKALTLLTAGASLPFYNEMALAQLSMVRNMPKDAVKINANENPMGPCKEAAEAIHGIVSNGGRYMYEETFTAAQTLADLEGLKLEQVKMYPGSSEPLHRAVLAFCSKDKPFVVGDPGYEAGAKAAEFIGAPVVKVPLAKGSAIHDVKAMAAAHKTPGVIYLCNPNNPTGTVTPKEDIDWLVANLPKGSILLLDEAYIHLSKAPFGTPYVAAGKDVVILRTFSKLYGMAGIRAGAALGKPEHLEKMAAFGAGALPITAMVAATASLKSKTVIPERRKIIADIREDMFSFLAKNHIEFLPSDANMFMMNVHRPGKEFAAKMAEQKIYIGRSWPVWPNWVRVTVGTKEEMAKFQKACLECYTG